jgi:hypothetical protein
MARKVMKFLRTILIRRRINRLHNRIADLMEGIHALEVLECERLRAGIAERIQRIEDTQREIANLNALLNGCQPYIRS